MTWSQQQLDGKRAEYQRRKDARLCVTCMAGLQPRDGVRCIECREANGSTTKAWAARKVKSRSADGIRSRYQRNRSVLLADLRETRLELKSAGVCTRCGCEPALDDSVLCATCRPKERARIADQQRRRRARDPEAARQRQRDYRARARRYAPVHGGLVADGDACG